MKTEQFTEAEIENAFKYYKKLTQSTKDIETLLKIFSFINEEIDMENIKDLTTFKYEFRKLQMQKLEIEGLHKFSKIVEKMILSGKDISLGKAIEAVRYNIRENTLNDIGSIHIYNTLEYIERENYAISN